MPLLSGSDRLFNRTVNKTIGFRTKELDDVVRKVDAFIEQPFTNNLLALQESVLAWKAKHPKEYEGRLGVHRNEFEAELANQAEATLHRWVDANNYVAQYAHELREFATYAVQDVLAFPRQVAPGKELEVFARYHHWARYFPDTRFRMPAPAIAKSPTSDWARHLRNVYEATRYTLPQTVAYLSNNNSLDNQGNPKPRIDWGDSLPGGAVRLRALGSAVCTSFAKAGAHILTRNAPSTGAPRVEIVARSGGTAMSAHVYLLVGRLPHYGPNGEMPTPDRWNIGTMVVDPWAAALGHHFMWKPSNFPASFIGMREPLSLVMKSEDLKNPEEEEEKSP